MKFEDIIVVVILVAIAVSVLVYVGKQKKQGNKCIGCPYGGKCNGGCSEQNKD